MWCVGLVLLGIPFLEVASHSLRRAFHERASDTFTITLKSEFDSGPHPLESRFISSWMRLSFLFFLFIGVLSLMRTHQGLITGAYADREVVGVHRCKELKNQSFEGNVRLDAAMTLFVLKEISSECLDKEAETALWSDPQIDKELAYLAKYFVSDFEVKNKYLEKLCRDEVSEVCGVARLSKGKSASTNLTIRKPKLFISQLLQSDSFFAAGDYQASLKLITELQKFSPIKEALEKRFVRAVWSLREEGLKAGDVGRKPASVGNLQPWLDTFKKRYEVP
jgi:hypothetical protein